MQNVLNKDRLYQDNIGINRAYRLMKADDSIIFCLII